MPYSLLFRMVIRRERRKIRQESRMIRRESTKIRQESRIIRRLGGAPASGAQARAAAQPRKGARLWRTSQGQLPCPGALAD